MMISFAPLTLDAVDYLSDATGIDYRPFDLSEPQWFCVSAYDDGRLMGLCVFEFKTRFDAHFSLAIADKRCISRRLLRVIFGTVFSRAVRVTALVDPDNRIAIRQMKLFGFVYEGFLRMGVEGTRDALMFGMLRADCRYLPGYSPATATVRSIDIGGHHGLLS